MIPGFNESGVLPPYIGENPSHKAQMAPYEVSVGDIARRFALSLERAVLFLGFLDYREKLRQIGIKEGFQWIDGSFVEDVERVHERAPNDIDVITFAHFPVGGAQAKRDLIANYPHIFDFRQAKEKYHCDVYFVDLDIRPAILVNDARYWFGLFSHQRESFLWKGMLSVSLHSDDDQARRIIQEDGYA